MSHTHVACLDIGGTQCSAALCTAEGHLAGKRRFARPQGVGPARMAEELVRFCRTLQKEYPGLWPSIGACGISFGGPVAADGAFYSMHVEGWPQVDLPGRLRREFGWRVAIENDANCGTLGEHRFGAGRGSRHLVYLTVSTGIGGGIVLDGQLFRGSQGYAGEIGHTTVRPDGPPCACGRRGCLESLCSGVAIAQRVQHAARHDSQAAAGLLRLAAHSIENLDAKTLFDAARQGDVLARRVVADICDDFAIALANLFHIFDPDLVVLGGGVSKAGDALFRPLRERLRARLLRFHSDRFRIEPAEHPDDASLLGAAVIAFERT